MRVLGDRANGLDSAAVCEAASRALEDAPRTFEELRSLLSAAFPTADERALGHAVRMRLPLVMVPDASRWGYPRAASFALAQRWLGRPVGDETSPESLLQRYLAAFGPASVADAQAWSGLSGVGRALDRLRGELMVFRDEGGRELFDLPDAPRPPPETPAPARFLPAFDNLVLAHADRTRLIADEHRPLVVTRNLRVNPTFLCNGCVSGAWTVTRKHNTMTMTLSRFAPISDAAIAELAEEGERLAAFVAPDATSFDIAIS